MPLPSNVIARELRVPTLDFGSRLELRTRNGVTTVSASNSSEADIVDLSIADVCPVRKSLKTFDNAASDVVSAPPDACYNCSLHCNQIRCIHKITPSVIRILLLLRRPIFN